MKNLPALSVIAEVFYDDGITLRWKVSPKYDIAVGDEAGTLHPNGYRYVKFRQESYRVHRVLWMMRTGEDPGELEIDHENRRRDDNSDGNLKLVGKFAQAQNKGVYSSNSSGRTGVSQVSGGRWCAYINRNGVRIGLGRFDTKEEAIAARQAGEIISQDF